jgi:hypothetical protein
MRHRLDSSSRSGSDTICECIYLDSFVVGVHDRGLHVSGSITTTDLRRSQTVPDLPSRSPNGQTLHNEMKGINH